MIHRNMAISLLFPWLAKISPIEANEFDRSALFGGLTEKMQCEGLLTDQQAFDQQTRMANLEARSLDDWGKVWHIEKHCRFESVT